MKREARLRLAIDQIANMAVRAITERWTYADFTIDKQMKYDRAIAEARTKTERAMVHQASYTAYDIVSMLALEWRLRWVGDTHDGVASCTQLLGWPARAGASAIEGRHVWPRQPGETEDHPWSPWKSVSVFEYSPEGV